MIQVENLHKAFKVKKTRKEAVKNVSFTAESGKIFGLLGPNGAGKTTCLRIIATLLKADQGTVTVDGIDVRQDPRKVRDRIGFLTSDMKLTGNLSPREIVTFFGHLNHLEDAVIRERLEKISGYLDMNDFLDKPVEKLSTGMCQKASIAVSLIHDPQVIIFDEPTNGLDILAAKTVVDFLRDYRDQGKTVIVSTHIMSEAEKLCDQVGIILDGELAAEGTQQELKERYNQASLEDVFFYIAQEKGVLQDA
ncbi:ABC transporter ATP-binding protein [Spirochaeta dissipatitropha]